MTDRELLEAAAKAAGKELPKLWDHTEIHHWNPLQDDGDALRLAVKLGTSIFISDGIVAVDDKQDAGDLVKERLSFDPCAATRRAIVRAAAVIAKQGA